MATVSVDISNRLDIVAKKGDTFELNLEFGVIMPFHDDAPTASQTPAEGKYEMKIATSNTAVKESLTISYVSSNGEATSSKLKITSSSGAGGIGGLAPGLYVYDLQVTDTDGTRFSAGDVKTLLYGTFKVNDDVGL